MAQKISSVGRHGNPPVVLPGLGVAVGFRPEYLDFERGIHVGNLEENQRITRILKLALEARYGQGFVTERWGRGVYWQWIGYLPRAAGKVVGVSRSIQASDFPHPEFAALPANVSGGEAARNARGATVRDHFGRAGVLPRRTPD
jgi:hypothetical protein